MAKNQESFTNNKSLNPNSSKSLVWDCGSNLYDSFELKSFERQLYSAIHSRTLSMPHLPDRRVSAVAPPPPNPPSKKPSSNKISRSFQKFIKSMFRSNKQNSANLFRFKDRPEYYVVYDKSGALSTIPEAPEIDMGGFSPEINSLVRRTNSGSFAVAPSSIIGISCA